MSLASVILGTLYRHTPRFLLEGAARAFTFEAKVREVYTNQSDPGNGPSKT